MISKKLNELIDYYQSIQHISNMNRNKRNFIKSTAASAVTLAAGRGLCGTGDMIEKFGGSAEPSLPDKPSRVVICRRQQLFNSGIRPEKSAVKTLLKQSLEAFFDQKNTGRSLNGIFNPGEKIGIKVNCLSGKSMSTHPELAYAVAELLIDSGVQASSIRIWDRKDKDLSGAGYQLNRGRGIKVSGVDTDGYGKTLIAHRSIGSFFARVLEESDKIINIPVLKDHGIVGVTLGLKNFFGAIHNPHKYHLNAGDPYIADLYSHSLIRDKVKLTIIDGITAQYEGGPPPMPQWQWNYGGLIVGEDPVAVDWTGLDIIETKRSEMGFKSLEEVGRYPEYLRTAEKLGLGVFKRKRIESITV